MKEVINGITNRKAENIIKKLKMHRHAIALGLSVIIIAWSFAYIFSLRNNSTIYLQDLEGDRNVLSDLVITGYLQDRYHGLKFLLDNGNITQKFIYYEGEKDMHMPTPIYVNSAPDDEILYGCTYLYKIADDANKRYEYSENITRISVDKGSSLDATEKITKIYVDKIDVYMNINKYWLPGIRKKELLPDKNQLEFKTGVSLVRESMDFEFESKRTIYSGGGTSEQPVSFKSYYLINARYEGFPVATLNGKQYFTVINQGNRQTGENGIYVAVEYVDYIDILTGRNYGKVEKLVSFDLEKENINILGLHAVEDNLVAVMLVDNLLTFRAYDPKDGKLLAELTVPEFEVSGSGVVADTDSWIRYTPYIHGNTLSLNITKMNRENYQNGIVIYPSYINIVSVKISPENTTSGNVKIDLLHFVKDFELKNLAVANVPAVVPVNNKLVVFAVSRSKQANEVSSANPAKISTVNEFLYPLHFNLLVFDGAQNSSRLLYSGEIVTDADEDVKAYRHTFGNYYLNDDSYQSSVLYSAFDYYENRNVGLITIKKKG